MATNLEFIKSASGTSVSSLDVTDCFNANYDVYKVVIPNFEISSGSTIYLQMRLLDSSGTVISEYEYDNATQILKSNASFANGSYSANLNYFRYLAQVNSSANVGIGTILYIYNPYNTKYTYIQYQSSSWIGSALYGWKGIGVHKVEEQISGLYFFPTSGNMDFDVSVYGVKS